MAISNPFTDRMYDLLDQDLCSVMKVEATAIGGLAKLPSDAAKNALLKHLEGSFYCPSDQSVAFVRRVLETGLAYALRAYPDVRTYLRQIQSASVVLDPEPETWISTGLAGYGKSAARKALQRLLSRPPRFPAGKERPERPILGGVFIQVGSRISRVEVLNQVAGQLGLEPEGGNKVTADFISAIKIELYRQGVMFMLLDEQQSLASGSTAGASFVNFIMFLRSFGVPIVVIGNYSMCWGILAQPSQNLHRLAVDPFLMLPDFADDPRYLEHLSHLKLACGKVLDIEPQEDASDVNVLSGGGSRALNHLICIAYRQRRDVTAAGSPAVVDLDALRAAYASKAYSVHRTEIDILRAHFLTGAPIKRKDLACPFSLDGESAEQHKRIQNGLLQAAVREKMLESSLTPRERTAIACGAMPAPELLPPPDMATLMGRDAPVRALSGKQAKATAAPSRAKRSPRPGPTRADAARGWSA